LISGVLINQNLEETITGVPQGGIISPVISNFVLDGLENCVRGSIAEITSSKNLVKEYYGQKSGIKVVKNLIYNSLDTLMIFWLPVEVCI
jgi:retron-type reverse transcriptase